MHVKATPVESPPELPYDVFAPVYNHFFGPEAARATFSAVEKLLLRELPPGSCVLDLCCGTGELSKWLTELGYRVTGVDSSAGMLDFARAQVPEAEFCQADIRDFRTAAKFDAVVCAYNSLPHITSQAELLGVFENVRDALLPAGRFLFDLYNERAYGERWRGSFCKVGDDLVCIVRASYDPATRRGQNLITAFRHNGNWTRADICLSTRCYSDHELHSLLERAGFDSIASHEAETDLGLSAAGRVFWTSRR